MRHFPLLSALVVITSPFACATAVSEDAEEAPAAATQQPPAAAPHQGQYGTATSQAQPSRDAGPSSNPVSTWDAGGTAPGSNSGNPLGFIPDAGAIPDICDPGNASYAAKALTAQLGGNVTRCNPGCAASECCYPIGFICVAK